MKEDARHGEFMLNGLDRGMRTLDGLLPASNDSQRSNSGSNPSRYGVPRTRLLIATRWEKRGSTNSGLPMDSCYSGATARVCEAVVVSRSSSERRKSDENVGERYTCRATCDRCHLVSYNDQENTIFSIALIFLAIHLSRWNHYCDVWKNQSKRYNINVNVWILKKTIL